MNREPDAIIGGRSPLRIKQIIIDTKTTLHIATLVPFCLPCAVLPEDRRRRLSFLDGLGRLIASGLALPQPPALRDIPRMQFLTRKEKLLEFDVTDISEIRDHVAKFGALPGTRHIFSTEKIYYFDYGSGFTIATVDIEVDGPTEFSAQAVEFRDHYKALLRSIVENSLCYHLKHWERFCKVFKQSLAVLRADTTDWLFQFSEVNYGYCELFVLAFMDPGRIMPLKKNDLEFLTLLSNGITGGENDVITVVDCFGLLTAEHGYDTSFITLIDPSKKTDAMLIIALSAMNWALFKSAYESILSRLENWKALNYSYKEIASELIELRRSEHYLHYCVTDSNPKMLAWNNFDKSLYEGLWFGWNTDLVIENTKKAMNGLREIITDKSEQMTLNARRLSSASLVFINFLVIIAIVLQVFSFYDFDTDRIIIDHGGRLVVIMSTLLMTLGIAFPLTIYLYGRNK